MAVRRVIQRIKVIEIEVYVFNDMSEEKIFSLLFFEKSKAKKDI